MSNDLYSLCSTLKWKLGINLGEWRDAREVSYRCTGKLQPKLDQLRSFACSIIQWNQEQFPMKSDAAAVLWATARLFQ